MSTFNWIDCTEEYDELIGSWLDTEAVKYTGIDEGWKDYRDYYINEVSMQVGGKAYVKIAFDGVTPFGVIAICCSEEQHWVSEYIISPFMRRKGYGTKALRDILLCGKGIIGEDVVTAMAVIFPNNVASQKCFEKAGFAYESAHPDGDAWYYLYSKEQE